jgi:hypothetical protein
MLCGTRRNVKLGSWVRRQSSNTQQWKRYIRQRSDGRTTMYKEKEEGEKGMIHVAGPRGSMQRAAIKYQWEMRPREECEELRCWNLQEHRVFWLLFRRRPSKVARYYKLMQLRRPICRAIFSSRPCTNCGSRVWMHTAKVHFGKRPYFMPSLLFLINR